MEILQRLRGTVRREENRRRIQRTLEMENDRLMRMRQDEEYQ
jgi:hypothetical protein